MDHLLENYRQAYALASEDHSSPHATILLPNSSTRGLRIFCSCSTGSYASCDHAVLLKDLFIASTAEIDAAGGHFWKPFLSSAFYKLLVPFNRYMPLSPEKASFSDSPSGLREILDQKSTWHIRFFPDTSFGKRLRSRLETSESGHFTRGDLFKRLEGFVLSETERKMIDAGAETSRLNDERSTWCRVAYHLYRENMLETISAHLFFESSERALVVEWKNKTGEVLLGVRVPAKVAWETARAVSAWSNGSIGFLLESAPAEIMFQLQEPGGVKGPVRIEPVINSACPDEKPRYQGVCEDYIFDRCCYIPAENKLVIFSPSSLKILAKRWHSARTIRRKDFSTILEEHADVFSMGQVLDLFTVSNEHNFGRFIDLPLLSKAKDISITPIDLESGRCRVDASVQFDGCAVGLDTILRARREGNRYVVSNGGLIDCSSESIENLAGDGYFGKQSAEGVLSLSRAELLRLKAAGVAEVHIEGTNEVSDELKSLFSLAPALPLRKPRSLKSKLRSYQRKGVQWLLFLWDNHLGGLLADEMGLGKTHQALGLMTALREQRKSRKPFLVVCPTTVISHWENLLNRFAPGIDSMVHHGSERALDSNGKLDCIITSYGVLRNDIEHLRSFSFDLIIFDEIQCLKNRATHSSRAAAQLEARCRLGLTGTPVQNSPGDLKALFDLVLPGFLGSDERFRKEFLDRMQGSNAPYAAERLRRRIGPFILRRLKNKVVKELPSRIDDDRTCDMTPPQRTLYLEALATRGASLIDDLKDNDAPIPYMHIFALMGYLKQLCNHPALVRDDLSGEGIGCAKWDLFLELLSECLEAGQKVVVFSQYLGMLDMIGQHLNSVDIAYVKLTGSTAKRGDVLRRFQSDSSCRVFLGSVKAGGVGIDLTSANTVIHYDRWWNAAVEDQATDRVHRIGQKSSVQVFRLITRNTIEERIDLIIKRKRKLSESLLPEDSAESLKSFSREELLEILGA